MSNRKAFSILAPFIFLAFLLPATAQTLQTPSQPALRIVSPIDDSVRTLIPGSTHPLARPGNDVGPVDGGTTLQRMILVLSASPDQQLLARTLLDRQQTKGTSDYRHWLTPEEFGSRFGASTEDIRQVTGWLQSQGFSVGIIAKSGRWIEFSGNSAQVEMAFQTKMRRYQAAGTVHIANAGDISIPTALAPVVRGVLSLNDFFKQPKLTPIYQVQRNSQGQLIPVNPGFTLARNAAFHFLAPGDYAKIYDLNPLYQNGANGSGETIAIVARSKIDLTDVAAFRQIFNLPVATPPAMTVNGTDPGVTATDDTVEATLDVEWSAAVAPQAAVNLVVSASTATTDGVDLSSAFIVDNNLASIMSVSFGECEQNLGTVENAFFSSLWQQAAAQGISVFVSAGDSGAAGCDNPNDPDNVPAAHGLAVSGIASTPFNTAVGGTEFNENGDDSVFWNSANGPGFSSVNGYIPEMVWNDSCDPTVATSPCAGELFNLFASSGGASGLYSKPSWQSLNVTGVPNDNQRDLPDVSLTASAQHDGYLFCFLGSCQTSTDANGNPLLEQASVVGGTSASSPSFAGIMAIVDQETGGRQGLANYVLYSLAAAANFSNCNSSNRNNPGSGTSCLMNDTTAGSNTVPGQTGFNAATGYDLATGLGSVDASNLVNAWVNQIKGFQGTTTTLTAGGSTSIQHGQPISFTITVQPIAGNAAPTGNASLLTSLTGAAGAGSLVTVGAGVLANGVFTGAFSNLPGGQYSVTAHYPGDANFQGSDSNAVTVNIAKENSSTTLTAFVVNSSGGLVSGSSASYGSLLQLHSAVTGVSGQGFASGSVTLMDGSSQLAVLPLNSEGQSDLVSSGTAALTLTVGSHMISANYSGDNSFNASFSASPLSLTVTQATPTVFLTASQLSVPQGQPVTLGAVVQNSGPILPTGTVQFLDGSTPLGSPAQLSSRTPGAAPLAALQTSFTTTGTHSITATYAGDATYASTPSQFSIPITVTAAPSTGAAFQFSGSPGNTAVTIGEGQTATFNIFLVPSTGFTGAVAIACSGAPSGTNCTVNPGSVTFAGNDSNVLVAVTVAGAQNSHLFPAKWKAMSIFFAGVFAVLIGLQKKRRQGLLMFMALCLIAGISSCGGGNSGSGQKTSTLTVTGTSGSQSASIDLSLTVVQ